MKKVVFGLLLAIVVGSVLLVHVYQVPPPALANNPIKSQPKAVAVKAQPQLKPTEQTSADAHVESKPNTEAKQVNPKPQAKQATTSQPTTPAQASTALTAAVSNAGKPIVANTLQYTIAGAKVSLGEGPIKPGEGNVYLLVDLTIENTGNNPVSISPVMVFNLVDSNQTSYSPIVLNQSEQAIDGMLGPGRSVTGQLRFEVPQTLKAVTLQIDSSLVGANTSAVSIAINRD